MKLVSEQANQLKSFKSVLLLTFQAHFATYGFTSSKMCLVWFAFLVKLWIHNCHSCRTWQTGVATICNTFFFGALFSAQWQIDKTVSFCPCSSSQVSGEVAGGTLCLPHVQQAHSGPPGAAPQHRDSAGWTGVTSHLPPPAATGWGEGVGVTLPN